MTRVICTACSAENEAGRKFCLACGTRLSISCPGCGTANTPDAKFCGECGGAMADAASSTSPAAPTTTTERRLVSVLFADLVGFTTYSEGRDAEDVRAMLDRYFDTCRDVVDRYGGTIEKFIGDAVMAVWGTPVALEDDAERAVRAALDLVEAVRRIGSEAEAIDLALRAAVHTGEAVVTIGAAGMGMVAGDLVNTASRLQSVAASGTVLVGEGTQRAASTAIAFEPAGAQDLKGKVVPVSAYRALRVVAQRGGIGRAEALEPPFVGRATELGLVKEFYHAVARDRSPRLVSVIGQAGIGKSRLVWEFLKYIDGVTETVYWHQGRSPAYGEGISFWALGEMVRMRIGVEEGADEAGTRTALAASLDEFVTDADERLSLERALLHLLGIGDAASAEPGRLFVAWRTFFQRIADVAPVVMVFEDVQWADDGLLDFVEELITWSHGRPIYVVTLARPELLDRRPTWGASQRSFSSLGLTPLTERDMRELLAGFVPGLPTSTVDRIVDRAEGIPLYAVEMVRSLLGDGRLVRKGEGFVLADDSGELAVPESLHALIAARIDALPAAERGLVQDASVLGLSFAPATLAAITRSAPEDVEPGLARLLQREILAIDTDPRSPERGQYRFIQGLLREVAYGTLTRDDRRARHLAAARFYESLGDDELTGVLAQHYVDAYQAHPDGPEGAAVAAQARVALRGAAQRASQLGSHRLANKYLESAIAVTVDPDEELGLRLDAIIAAATGGLLDAAATHGRRAIELARDLGRDTERRLATAHLADVLIEGHQHEALELLNAALSEAGFEPGSPGWVEIATVLAKVEMRSLHPARAVELADLALPEASRAGNDEAILDLLVTRGVALPALGRTTEAVAILTGALDLARRRNVPRAAGRAAVNLSYTLQPDDPETALTVTSDALEYARRYGNVVGIRYLLGNAISTATDLGQWDWALDQAQEMESILTEPADRVFIRQGILFVRILRGEDHEAEARDLYELGRGMDDPQARSNSVIALMTHALVHGDHDLALRLLDEAITTGAVGHDEPLLGARAALWAGDLEGVRRMRASIADELDGRLATAARAQVDAGVATLEGRRDDARRLYGEARQLLRDVGAVYPLAAMDLDIVIGGIVGADERERAANEAREIFTELGAVALLDRLDAALAEQGTEPRATPSVEPVAEGLVEGVAD